MLSRTYLNYLALLGVIVLGGIFRMGNLDLKPLWLDEVITAIFSLGKTYSDLPLDTVFSLRELPQIFTLVPGVSCPQIAAHVIKDSTHPPLFFCWMYSWLSVLAPLGSGWVGKLRSLPAVFGVVAIAVIYVVNTIAFSRVAGLWAAVVIAISPFAVYLSQEARHYTLPMLAIALALCALLQIQRDIYSQRCRFWVWCGWASINSLSFYIHYFCILAFIAQIGTLVILMLKQESMVTRRQWRALILAISGVLVSFLPWVVVLWGHSQRSETSWLEPTNFFAPLYQTLINWVLMVIALPVENQPVLITAICGLLMVLSSIWVGWQVYRGFKLLWQDSSTHLATLTLSTFTLIVLAEFFAIAYFLHKDITSVPRYSFVYYPSFCALIGASFSRIQVKKPPSATIIFLLIGIISCICVISNLAFQKPFQPEQVAQIINQEPTIPLMLVVGYRDYQDVALGLSFAFALEKLRSHSPVIPPGNLAFFKQSPDFASVWQKLLSTPTASTLNLWVVGPGIRRRDYPQQVMMGQNKCLIDPSQHYRIGVPYQLYRCQNHSQL